MNRVTLTLIALTTLALTTLAQAQNYPSQYPYLCDTELPWGSFDERIIMHMDNSGSVRHGTLQIHTQDGNIITNQAVLRDRVRPEAGTLQWRLDLPQAGIQCDMISTYWGQEIAVYNCSHGGEMRCARLTPALTQRTTAEGCADCRSRPLSQQKACYLDCVEHIADADEFAEAEQCGDSLLNAVRCLWVLLDLVPPQVRPEIGDVSGFDTGEACGWTGHCGSSVHGPLICIDGTCQAI